jgi:dipeptidyl aminopeptidase/acylaminoacyl peptidase
MLALAPASEAAFPGGDGKIAFDSNRSGTRAIFTMDPSGNVQAPLTPAGATAVAPDWSPDGKRVVFDRTFPGDIYVINADGSGQANITNSAANDFSPAWSPDGRQIVFGSDRDGNAEIYKMNADGTGLTRLTNNPVFDSEPDWSANGMIAFARYETGVDIYAMDSNGANLTNLTSNPASDFEPEWSPNGSRIAFTSDRDGPPQIYAMDANGSNQARVLASSFFDAQPAWSPSGARIAFARNPTYPDGNFQIHVMNANGTNEAQVTSTGDNESPDWQPLTGYPRPVAAAQLRVPLVIAYQPCTPFGANRTHGPTLNAPSCNPGQRSSTWLTTGTDDSNGFATQLVGSLRMTVCASGLTATGTCSTPPTLTNPDVRIEANVSDVRCAAGGPNQSSCQGGVFSDYTGGVQAVVNFRVTDRHNSTTPGGSGDTGTVVDLPLPINIPCQADPAGGTALASGGTCSVLTSVDVSVPGAIQPRKRGIWELGPIQVFDGGQSGQAGAPDSTPFLRQGISVP